jgi:flagellin FlaB
MKINYDANNNEEELMKQNKKFLNDNHAQAGIGTLIIFIAMVLVAAVAAAVLINTSGILQQKAQKTGTEAIAETSSNIMVDSITGERTSSTASTLTTYKLIIKPSAGTGRIDVNQLRITAADKDTSATLTHGTTANATYFNSTEKRDEDNSFDASASIYVINSGDLVELYIDASSVSIDAAPRSDLSFILTPEVGTPVRISLTTPSSYGINTIVRLYPAES